MNQAVSIWAPVVVSSFPAPKTYERQSIYPVDEGYRRIDDIKVTMNQCQVERRGKDLEIIIKLDILCVLENMRGKLEFIKKEEILRERVPLSVFGKPIAKTDLEFILETQDLYWDGDLKRNEILINYYVTYIIRAVQKQVVELVKEHEPIDQMKDITDFIEKLEVRIEKLNQENSEMRQKIFCQERNILSLQRGIKNTEKQNYELIRQLQGKRKDMAEQVVPTRNYPPRLNQERIKKEQAYSQAEDHSLGKRIKQLFQNSG